MLSRRSTGEPNIDALVHLHAVIELAVLLPSLRVPDHALAVLDALVPRPLVHETIGPGDLPVAVLQVVEELTLVDAPVLPLMPLFSLSRNCPTNLQLEL